MMDHSYFSPLGVPAVPAVFAIIVHLVLPALTLAQENEATLEFLLTRNEQAAAKVASFDLDFRDDAEFEISGAISSVDKRGHIVRRGEAARSIMTVETRPGRHGRGEIVYKSRAVVNESYFAYWKEGEPYAERLDHQSKGEYHPRAGNALKLLAAPDFRFYGFGTGGESLRSARDKTRRTMSWSVRREPRIDAEPAFIIDVHSDDEVGQNVEPAMQYTIDPNKGFVVTKVVVSARELGISRIIDVEVAPLGTERIWFPTRISEVTKPPTGFTKRPGGKAYTITRSVIFENIKLNGSGSDDSFEMSSLKLPPSVEQMVRITTDNRQETLLRRGDEYVSEEAARLLDSRKSPKPATVPTPPRVRK